MAVETGVGFLLSCAHRDKKTGEMHGHTYEVTCWYRHIGDDAEQLRDFCKFACRDLDHSVLPEDLAWAEQLATEVKRRTGASEVIVARPLERLYARDK